MNFPSVEDVARELESLNDEIELREDDIDEGCDVRLQVYKDGDWAIRWGLADYDQDHLGYWGSSNLPGNGIDFDAEDIAKDLIEQVEEQYCEDQIEEQDNED